MEVKVFCPCGSKYKFDVEPVNERMPWAVNCPTCGADGTALANQIIAQTIAANPSAVAPPPVYAAAPAPIAAAAPPPQAPPPIAGGGLRINKPEVHAPAAPPPIGGAPPPAGSPPRFTPATSRPLAAAKPPASTESILKKIGGALTGVLAVAFIILKIWRIWRIGHALTGGISALSDPQIAAAMAEAKEMNLIVDNGVALYVKNDDYHAVAQECMAFWKEKQHHTYEFITPDRQSGTGAEYQFFPAHNGYVRIMGELSWKDPMFESTAQHLSEKYSTMVFAEKEVDATSEFSFGVYDQGQNVFRAHRTFTRDEDAKVKTDHLDWAKAHGYTPGKHGTTEFNELDANQLTKAFGMKFWDFSGEDLTNYVVLAARQ